MEFTLAADLMRSCPKLKMYLCNVSVATNQISITHFSQYFYETNQIPQ